MYKLFAKYIGCSWEEIDSFDNLEEAEKILYEYRAAFGNGFIWKVVMS